MILLEKVTIEDVQGLIKNRVQESLHLDYKRSPAISDSNRERDEIAKDVSAFANSDGGIIIYGVEEDKNTHFPIRIDEGIEHSTFSKEWLENVISSNITPKIDNLEILPISLNEERSIYVIKIPKSYRGPHQASSKRYYKRFNFKSEAMEDYEINDIRNRRLFLPPLVEIETAAKNGVLIQIVVTNRGNQPAEAVAFEFSKELPWIGKTTPPLFQRGIKYFYPGKTFKFTYNTFQAICKEDNQIPSEFDIVVSYIHPQIGQRIIDAFHIDLMDYICSSIEESEFQEHGKALSKAIEAATKELRELKQFMSKLANLSAPTGLNLSITCLKNLNHLLSGSQQRQLLSPEYLDITAFQEILDVDIDMACNLMMYFRHRKTDSKFKNIHDINGMNDELLEKIRQYFKLD